MKNLLQLAAGISLISGSVLAEGPIDSGRDLVFPEFDYKYIQFLPEGHLVKNKPRYRKFNWQIRESKHFEIFTYDLPKELAEFYLTEAEKVYEEYGQRTKMHSFAEKIKVIIFNSVRDCQETNMVPGLWPEALGGLTEMVIRKRVVLAYRDSPMGFRHIIRHELYHRYQAEFIKKGMASFLVWSFTFPLWFAEGSAEYFSTVWDADKELTMRDAYLNGYLAPATELHWQPGLVYTEGHFVVNYLAERYKDKGDVVSDIIRASKELSFAQAFELVTGESLEKFNKELSFYVETRYRNLSSKRDLTDDAKILAKGVLLDARDNFFITKTHQNGRTVLLLNWSDGLKVYSKKFVEDGRLNSADLHGLGVENSPGFGFPESGAVFGNGDEVVYSIDTGKQDEIRVQEFSFDKKKKKFRIGAMRAYRPKGVTDIRTPIRINEDQFAFIGRGSVFAEVFLFNRKTGETKQLSSLKRNCHSLTYSRHLNALVVSAENEKTGSYDLAICKLGEDNWKLLAETKDNEWDPKFSADGKKLLYVSDQGLAYNIYLRDFESQTVSQLTDVKIGVFRPAWHGADGIWFNSFRNQKLRVQTAPIPVQEAQSAAVSKPAAQLPASVSESATEFLCYVPNLTDWTIMDMILSEDKTKALFVVNRRLSLRKQAKGESDIGFCVVNKESGEFWTFSSNQVDDLDLFAGAQFLAGDKILLRNVVNGQEELFVYDWKKRDLQFLDPGKIFGFRLRFFWSTNQPTFSRVSPDRKFVVLIRNHVLVLGQKVMVYDVLAGRFAPTHSYKEMVNVLFPDEKNVLVVGSIKKKGIFGPKENILALLNLYDNEAKELGIELDDKIVSVYFLEAGKIVVLITERSEKKDQSFNVWLLDPAQNTVKKILADLPTVKATGAPSKDVLVLETVTSFGLKRTIKISQNGVLETEDEKLSAASVSISAFAPPTPLDEQILNFDASIPRRMKNLKRLPRKYIGQFGGSIATNPLVISVYTAVLALDELNNQAFSAVVAVQGKQQGFADIQYDHLPSGRSFGVLYWDSEVRSKLELNLNQNIFLDRFLNWDLKLKEQRFSYSWGYGNNEYWQTKLGTTFSLNDTSWDPHGPHSGNAVFSGAEIGLKNGREYQATDLNLDARYHLPITERSSLAFRFAGGISFGPHPTSFIGGGNQTIRGIPLFNQSGNNYAFQSSELRLPVMDFLVGKFSSDFVDGFLGYAVRFYDIRGGLYGDVGDIWYDRNNGSRLYYLDHSGFKLQYSAGYFLNIPLMAFYGRGVNFRFNQGLYGNKGLNFWMGYDW